MAAFTMVNEELLQSDPSLAPPLSTNWLEREKSATRWGGEPVLLGGGQGRCLMLSGPVRFRTLCVGGPGVASVLTHDRVP